MTIKFQVGQTYAARSICDYDCIHSFIILSRTAGTVKINVHGKIVSRRISIHNDVEQIKPHGSYSMSLILGADDTAEKIEAQLARAAELAAQRVAAARARIGGFIGT